MLSKKQRVWIHLKLPFILAVDVWDWCLCNWIGHKLEVAETLAYFPDGRIKYPYRKIIICGRCNTPVHNLVNLDESTSSPESSEET